MARKKPAGKMKMPRVANPQRRRSYPLALSGMCRIPFRRCRHFPIFFLFYFVGFSSKALTGHLFLYSRLYSMLANFIITLCAGLGVLLVPFLMSRPHLQTVVMGTLMGLAVGTLLGDSILHLIPQAFGIHEHDDHHDHGPMEPTRLTQAEHTDHDNGHIWMGLVMVLGALAFYIIEIVLHSFGHAHSHSHGDHGHGREPTGPALGQAKLKPIQEDVESADTDCHSGSRRASGTHIHGIHLKESEYNSKKVLPVAWLILVGDAVHNSMDGLTIGIAFSSSWKLGLSTALAVLLHELPHELGDYAVLLHSGIPKWRAAMYNMICNTTAFVGVALGILLYQFISTSAQRMVLAATAGGFLYIALADLVPLLFEMAFPKEAQATVVPSSDVEFNELNKEALLAPPSKGLIIGTQVGGVFCGVLTMLLIALYEGSL
jgi:zinc transporter ZupT